MGAIAAALDKRGSNVVPAVVAMLKDLTHRGNDGHGVATPESVITAKSIEEMSGKELRSSVAIGHNLSCILPRDKPQPVLREGFTFVFEGRLFPSPILSGVEKFEEELGSKPHRNVVRVIEVLEGSYVFVIAFHNKIVAGRDVLGTNPLYFGESENICALASERKALWRLGIGSVKSFPPGHLAIVNTEGYSFKSIKTIEQPCIEEVNVNAAAKSLHDLLFQSVNRRLSDVERVAIAFSGGLDSSVIAVLAKNCGIDVQLVSVGLESHSEVDFVQMAAEALGLPLFYKTYEMSDVERILPKVLWLIEESDVLKASIAIPFYWTAENTSRLECKILFSGQGGDELFGGYQKYMHLRTLGIVEVLKEIYQDVSKSYERNLQRDNQVCSFHKVELRLPFMDRDVVDFSLGLPVSLKIKSEEDKLRKRILRRVARKIAIPSSIAYKTKKAIQYSTGVDKAIQRLAKRKSFTVREYVDDVFKKAFSIYLS